MSPHDDLLHKSPVKRRNSVESNTFRSKHDAISWLFKLTKVSYTVYGVALLTNQCFTTGLSFIYHHLTFFDVGKVEVHM